MYLQYANVASIVYVESPSRHLAPTSSQATEYSESKAPGFPFDTATEMNR